MAAGGHFGCPKLTLDHISGHFLDQNRFIFFSEFLYKMAAGGHFGCPKIILDLMSGHFRPIRNFIFFGNF